MSIPLEDNATDIIGKAQRGLGVDDAELAKAIGVEESALEAIKEVKGAKFSDVEKLAKALELGPRTLVTIAEGKYTPVVTLPRTGFFQATTAYGSMNVNAYLVWDEESGIAAAFDTGGDATPLIDELKKRSL